MAVEYKDAVRLVLSPERILQPMQPVYYSFGAYVKNLVKFANNRRLKVGVILYDPAAETVTCKVEDLNKTGISYQAWLDQRKQEKQ